MNSSAPKNSSQALNRLQAYTVSIWLCGTIAILLAAALLIVTRSQQRIESQVHRNQPPIHDSTSLLLNATDHAIANSISRDLAQTPLGFAGDIPVVSEDSELQTASFRVESPLGRVLVVRGIMTVFSLGMNELGRKLQASGYEVHVTPAYKSSAQAERLSRQILHQQNNNMPLVIIGHSLGGDLAPKLAAVFDKHKIPVDLLIMLDSTMPTSPPSNVRHCINMYQSSQYMPLFHGRRIENRSRNTHLVNVDIRRLADPQVTASIHHFNIDTNPWVQDLLVQAVHRGTEIQNASDFLISQPASFESQYPIGFENSFEEQWTPTSQTLERSPVPGIQMTFGDSPERTNK